MKILLLGATGLVGGHVLERLLADERVRVPIEAGLQKISRAAQGRLEIYRPPGREQHAGQANSWRYRSRRRAVFSRGGNRH